MISLPSLIERAARLNPTTLATRFHNREHSWQQLAQRIGRVAAGLQTFGLDEGDRVAILSLNNDRYYESIFAIPWAGYCVVPLNTRWALPENQYAIDDSGTRIVLFDDAFTEQTAELLNNSKALIAAIYIGEKACPEWARSYEELIENNDSIPPSTRGGDDMAGIFYTGGTTGFPKGAGPVNTNFDTSVASQMAPI